MPTKYRLDIILAKKLKSTYKIQHCLRLKVMLIPPDIGVNAKY